MQPSEEHSQMKSHFSEPQSAASRSLISFPLRKKSSFFATRRWRASLLSPDVGSPADTRGRA